MYIEKHNFDQERGVTLGDYYECEDIDPLLAELETLRAEKAELKASLYEQKVNRKVQFEELDHDGELNFGSSADGAWFQIGNQKFHIANSAEGESANWWHNQLIIAFERFSQSENERLQNNLEAVESDKEKLIAHIELIEAEKAKLIAERDEMYKKLEDQDDHCKVLSMHIDDLKADNSKILKDKEFENITLNSMVDRYQFERDSLLAEREAMMKQEPIYQFTDDEKELWKDCNKSLYEVFPDETKRIVYRSPLPAQQIPEGYALEWPEPYALIEIDVDKGISVVDKPSHKTVEVWTKHLIEKMLSANQPKGDV